jgi:hypothetical protein
MQSRYASKLLSNPPAKRMGPFTQFIVLQALGIKLQAVEDPELSAVVRSRLIRRRGARHMPSGVLHAARFELAPDFFRLIGIKGGKTRMARMTAKQRSRHGRKTARARWPRDGKL